ncbi:MAG: class I SAM-dependent methyltransferase [Neisseriaceae bacterium]|nr:class I SAM-dependent methyltransferase [Neisseriaceae bacterium]
MNAVLPVVFVSSSITDAELQRLSLLLQPLSVSISFRQPESKYFLQYIDNKVVLSNHQQQVFADFVGGALNHRIHHRGAELIAKAVDIKKNKSIWDATAGLGRDAFVLASLGASVAMFERHFVPATLLADALLRGKQSPDTQAIISRMSLNFGTISNTDLPCPDVLYLDPMFPERQKSALVKKEMRFFQAAVGEDNDSADLLDKARTMPVKRIVVKRPKHGAFIGNLKPAYQYVGKSTRFDVYLPFQAA